MTVPLNSAMDCLPVFYEPAAPWWSGCVSFTFGRSLAVFISIEEPFWLCRRRRRSLGLRDRYFQMSRKAGHYISEQSWLVIHAILPANGDNWQINSFSSDAGICSIVSFFVLQWQKAWKQLNISKRFLTSLFAFMFQNELFRVCWVMTRTLVRLFVTSEISSFALLIWRTMFSH